LPRAFYRRVEKPLDRVGLIGGGELAWLTFERRVGREKDALAQLEHVGRAVVLHQWHRLQRSRHELYRPREVVVIEHRLVDIGDDAVGGRIGRKLRIEARLRDLDCDAQRLAGVGRIGRGKRREQHEDGGDEGGRERRPVRPFLGATAHEYFGFRYPPPLYRVATWTMRTIRDGDEKTDRRQSARRRLRRSPSGTGR